MGESEPDETTTSRRCLLGIALVSATLLMTELALTRIFSVVMFYHFAFLAISIGLFGLSASGVFAYVARDWLARFSTARLLAVQSLIYAVTTSVSLLLLVRMRVGLNYSVTNLLLMLAIYALAAVPFFTGGLVITLAISRMTSRINTVYATDLIGAAAGCLVLIPLINLLGAPGVVLASSALAAVTATLFAPRASRKRIIAVAGAVLVIPLASLFTAFDLSKTPGQNRDLIFSKWNSFSRVAVYRHGFTDWSLSPTSVGARPESLFMDIDASAATGILAVKPDLSNAQYLRDELTAFAYHLAPPGGFRALVIGAGGGRDLVSALVFGATHVDGVEINPLIANDVMRERFHDYSGGIYTDPRVRIAVDDGRSFVKRATDRYDIIQASLVDTWAATSAGAYTLTENSLYTVEAFEDYLDHLTEGGILTMTRWVGDSLRLVSLAQEACERRGWAASERIAIVRNGKVATFLLKRSAFTADEIDRLRQDAHRLQFQVIYAPGPEVEPVPDIDISGTRLGAFARLIRATDRHAFYGAYPQDITPTTDDRPFYFHTTKLEDQLDAVLGGGLVFGNGLSALLSLLLISVVFVLLFICGPLAIAARWKLESVGDLPRHWYLWLSYFGALGAGFMMIEVATLQRFVVLLGHPVYSLTVTLFSMLLGTGIGAALSRRIADRQLRRTGLIALALISLLAVLVILLVTPLASWAIPFSRPARMAIVAATLIPLGVVLGFPMPTGLRLLGARAQHMIPWAWGINGALSVVGSTMAVLTAMNWGFSVTLLIAAGVYCFGLIAFLIVTRASRSAIA